jgi:hypothetical protein
VSSNIVFVVQAASETRLASGQVVEAAGELAQQATAVRDNVRKYLQEVAAA